MSSQRENTDMARAADAWENVLKVKNNTAGNGVAPDQYKSRAKSIGALIMSAGLGPALTFLRTKDDASKALYTHISIWVVQYVGNGQVQDGETDLLKLLTRNLTPYYRRATTEALAYVVWLKRFVEVEL